MAIASIGLGSNMPYEGLTPAQVLSVAVEQLAQAGRVLACSSLYATEPVGYAGQPAFLNAAVALDTSLLPACASRKTAQDRAHFRPRPLRRHPQWPAHT